MGAGALPQVGPGAWVGDGTRWITSAAGYEAWEGWAAGGLADRLVAQVEAPANAIAEVRERCVLGQVVEEQHAAAAYGDGNGLAIQERLGNAAARRGAVGDEALAVTAWDHTQAAVV